MIIKINMWDAFIILFIRQCELSNFGGSFFFAARFAAKVSEEVNRNTTVQLLAPAPILSTAMQLVTDRRTDGRTDHIMIPVGRRIFPVAG